MEKTQTELGSRSELTIKLLFFDMSKNMIIKLKPH